MNIRIAVRDDADDLVRFNQAMAEETEGKELNAAVLAAGVNAVFDDASKGFYVVAEIEGRLMGGLMITYEWSDWRNSWYWWIQSVYILPEERGQQIYTKLYDFVKEKAVEKGSVCGFRLYVEKENVHAQRVYEAVGMIASHYLMYEQTN